MVTKPTKPIESLPSSFGGMKTNFSDSKINSGYEPDVPDILGGANLNYLLDTLGKKDTYHDAIADFINGTPIGKTITVDSNNNLVYADNINFSSRSLGEVITSTIPLADAGLHLLDGALLDGSGSYANFVTYIAGLVSTYPSIFTTEATWQTTAQTYGVCGKFVYNSVNNTLRLPKITGFIKGTLDSGSLGDVDEAKAPNITGYINGCSEEGQGIGGAFYANGDAAGGDGKNRDVNVYFDASRSSSVYKNGATTIEPQAIKVLYYIVVATSTKMDIEVDIDEIATDLNGKADVDLSNVNNGGTSRGGGWAMPSNTYTNLTLGASGTTYTAPANGWFIIDKTAGQANAYVRLENLNNKLILINHVPGAGNECTSYIPAKRGDVIKISYDATGTTLTFRFIYAQGSESEA